MLRKLFGGIDLTWPKVVVAGVVAGIVTALVAMFVPEGTSLHQLAVRPEAWVVMALIVVVNCQAPVEAALKAFVFFLVSQPLVYLIQVLAGFAGWDIFGYYGYWFAWTVAMLPAGFIGWHVKDDTVVSALLLCALTVLQAFFGMNYLRELVAQPPAYLLSTLFCFGSAALMIVGVLSERRPRLVAAGITAAACAVAIAIAIASPATNTGANFPLDANKLAVTDDWTVRVEDGAVEAELVAPDDVSPNPYLRLSNIADDGTYTVLLTDADGVDHPLAVTVSNLSEGTRVSVTYEDGTTDEW